jgi:hypothetical protein
MNHAVIERPAARCAAHGRTPALLRAGPALETERFAAVRRRMLLEFCKWDPQVGDVETLAPFPLLLPQSQFGELAASAEALAQETLELEQHLLRRSDLHARLGLPRSLRRVFVQALAERVTPAACRILRFDFHPTTDGWRVSEVNSDVPGGFAEASAFAALMAEAVRGERPGCGLAVAVAGDPAAACADALVRTATNTRGIIALLAAPGFMEDQQVIAGLARLLRERGVTAIASEPRQLTWQRARAYLRSDAYDGPLAALVRFYQGEWLARLPAHSGWRQLFVGGMTPIANPGSAILTESKRLPLVWNALGAACPTWRRVLPETRDPRDAPWASDDRWLIKKAFCNTGDSVSVRGLLPERLWRARALAARLFPQAWVAQRRFEITALETPAGHAFPCIGVHTVDGRACGLYGRLSPTPLIDYAAVDAAVLIEADVPGLARPS